MSRIIQQRLASSKEEQGSYLGFRILATKNFCLWIKYHHFFATMTKLKTWKF